MEIKDSYYEHWDNLYWEGYKCVCGNVDLLTYSGKKFIEKCNESNTINKHKYMSFCPNCNNSLFENFDTATFFCKKCNAKFTYEQLYSMKTGGLKFHDNVFILPKYEQK